MVVLRFHLDDVNHIPAAEKAELRAAFAAANLTPIIVETHAFVSSDRTHDNAFVKHINDAFITPYVQSIGNFHTHYARSDGCKGQYKQAAHFKWIEESYDRTGIRTDWSFFCSCHGKCDCDGEGGSIKNAADNYENHGAQAGIRVEHKLPDATSFVEWANNGAPVGSPHGAHAGLSKPPGSLAAKLKHGKLNSIYRRVFYHVPPDGPLGVKRKVINVKLEGSARQHSFVCTGGLAHHEPGCIQWRERSCHQCEPCWRGDPSPAGCPAASCTGPSSLERLHVTSDPTTSLGRALKSGIAVPLKTMLEQLEEGSMQCARVKGSIHEPWMLGRLRDSGPATESDVAEAKELGYSIKAGANVLRLQKYEAMETGSRNYVACKTINLVVPASALRRHNMLSNADTATAGRRCSRIKAGERYEASTFELKEADIRAIVAIMATEGLGTFKVEKILAHRTVTVRGKAVDEFLCKWEGWSRPGDDSWQRMADFEDDALRKEALEVASRTKEKSAQRAAEVDAQAQKQANAVDARAATLAAAQVEAAAAAAARVAQIEVEKATTHAGVEAEAAAAERAGAEAVAHAATQNEAEAAARAAAQTDAATSAHAAAAQTDAEAMHPVVKAAVEAANIARAEATTAAAESDTQWITVGRQQLDDSGKAITVDNIMEVSSCEDDCVMPPIDCEWEECTILQSGAGLCNVRINSDGQVCKDVPHKFIRPRLIDPRLTGPARTLAAKAIMAAATAAAAVAAHGISELTNTEARNCPVCLCDVGSNGGLVAELQCGHCYCSNCLASCIQARLRCCSECHCPCADKPHVPASAPTQRQQKVRRETSRQLEKSGTFTTLIYSTLKTVATYSSLNELLTLAELQRVAVAGDGNCGYYSVLSSGPDVLEHCAPGRGCEPAVDDYTRQQQLRENCVAWLRAPAQQPFCKDQPEVTSAFLKDQLRGKNRADDPMGEYAGSVMLRAMAAVEDVQLVVVDRKKLGDVVCTFQPAGSASASQRESWAQDVVPRLQRQQAGDPLPNERPTRVIVWNGEQGASGHFDATSLLECGTAV